MLAFVSVRWFIYLFSLVYFCVQTSCRFIATHANDFSFIPWNSNRVKRSKKPSSTRSLPSSTRSLPRVDRASNKDSDYISDKLSGPKVELPSLVSPSFKSRHELKKIRRKRKARQARLKKIERYRKLLNDSPELVLGSQHQSQVRLMLRLFFCQPGCISTWTWLRSCQEEVCRWFRQDSF